MFNGKPIQPRLFVYFKRCAHIQNEWAQLYKIHGLRHTGCPLWGMVSQLQQKIAMSPPESNSHDTPTMRQLKLNLKGAALVDYLLVGLSVVRSIHA